MNWIVTTTSHDFSRNTPGFLGTEAITLISITTCSYMCTYRKDKREIIVWPSQWCLARMMKQMSLSFLFQWFTTKKNALKKRKNEIGGPTSATLGRAIFFSFSLGSGDLYRLKKKCSLWFKTSHSILHSTKGTKRREEPREEPSGMTDWPVSLSGKERAESSLKHKLATYGLCLDVLVDGKALL